MARSLFAGRTGDTVASLFPLGSRQFLTLPVDGNGDPASVVLEVWDHPGGTRLTDLRAADATSPITSVVVPAETGQIPEFYGPDGVNISVYVKDPDGDFFRIEARLDSAATAAAAAKTAAETAAAQASAFGGTNNTQVAGMVTGAGPTKDALTATFERKVSRSGATTGQVPALQADGSLAFSTVSGGGGAPSGAAGGSLAGTYPNPSLAAGAVSSAEINAAIKDAAAATASLRTLGTGATQAAAGNHGHAAAAITGLAAVATSGSASDITTGTLPNSVLPPLAISETFPVASQAAMLALTAQQGDVAIRSDLSKSFILSTNSPSTLADWKELLTPTDAVVSVAGKVGVVSLVKADITDLGTIGNAASKNVGTTAGTVAAGDDSRITGAAQKASNLSDLASAATARTNLGAASATQGGKEKSAALSATTGTATGDCSAASIFTVVPTGNITLAFSNVPASPDVCTVQVDFICGSTVPTVTYPSGTIHAGGSAVAAVANKTLSITMQTLNGGTSWKCSGVVFG